jgi:hypothetical protein
MALMHEATYDEDLFARRAGKGSIVALPIFIMSYGIAINMFDGHHRLPTLKFDPPISLANKYYSFVCRRTRKA